MAYFCHTAKSTYSGLSTQMYGNDKPLMNSYLLEYATTEIVSAIVLGLVLLVIFKRFYIKSFSKIMSINAVSALVFMLLGSILFYSTHSATIN